MKKSEKALKKQAEPSKESQSQLSADILKELRELKQAQLDGNRHLKTLKIFGWVFIAAAIAGLFFFIKFTFALTAFMDELTVMFSSFIANLAAFNGFMENLSGTFTEFTDNLAAFNEFINSLSGWF